jgi:hypothetical protein
VKKATDITLINGKGKMENGQLPKSGIAETCPLKPYLNEPSQTGFMAKPPKRFKYMKEATI